jgi:hypothetical protein
MTTKPKRPGVSDADRDYMRRLGKYKAEANAEALRVHLSLPPVERLSYSLRMSREHFTAETLDHYLAEDNPAPFYERARELGFLDPSPHP